MVVVVVYADVLMLLNFTVDFFLIKLTAKIAGSTYKTYRMILACVLGGVSSLYIFLPALPWFCDLLFKLILAVITSLVAFGYKSLKALFRNTAVFFSISFSFAGAMLALYYVAKPNGMAVNNSVVYFNISPTVLIVFSVAAYFITALLRHLLSRNSRNDDTCEISISTGENEISATALIDSGNSLSDAFGMGEIIIADKKVFDRLFSGLSPEELDRRYRAIPCRTVSGTEILDGYRADKARVTLKEEKSEFYRPVIAISKTPLSDEAQVILNPRSM